MNEQLKELTDNLIILTESHKRYAGHKHDDEIAARHNKIIDIARGMQARIDELEELEEQPFATLEVTEEPETVKEYIKLWDTTDELDLLARKAKEGWRVHSSLGSSGCSFLLERDVEVE